MATHAFFDAEDSPIPCAPRTKSSHGNDRRPDQANTIAASLLRTGLALAQFNQRGSGEGEDGLLTALEAAGLDLQGTRLVVLSACDTSLGTIESGEGVLGLRRALVMAGAETQLTSLWRIDDAATVALMVDYYRRLVDGAGRAEALRAAQLTMLRGDQWSEPRYWAAFVAVGAWEPLPRTR